MVLNISWSAFSVCLSVVFLHRPWIDCSSSYSFQRVNSCVLFIVFFNLEKVLRNILCASSSLHNVIWQPHLRQGELKWKETFTKCPPLSPVLFRLSVKYNCRLNVVENDRLSHFKEPNKEADNVCFLNFVSTTSSILFVLIQPSAFLNYFFSKSVGPILF